MLFVGNRKNKSIGMCLSQGLEVGHTKTRSLLGEQSLDLLCVGLAVNLALEDGKVVNLELGDHGINIVEGLVDLRSTGLALGEVVAILDGTTNNTLVLLCGVLGSLLCLLCVGLCCLVGLLLLLLQTGLLFLGLCCLLGESGGLGLSFQSLLVLLGVFLLLELLDTLVETETLVDHLAQTLVVLGLSLLAGVVVLTFDVTLLVTVLVVIGDILIEVLEGSPAVEVVPEVVEVLDVFAGAVLVTELGDGLGLAETTLGLEDVAPKLVEVALLGLLLAWGLDLGGLINGIELATLDGVAEDLVGSLDALEEVVVLVTASSGSLVGVVLEDLSAVGLLDLLLGGLPAVLCYAENGVVVLALRGC